jgi:NADH:ubiquinone oxidoreductase subunit 5 (subunit L)/multisubunit Na+/H+ antiporter MnhA subunit
MVNGRAGKSRNILLVWFVWPLITLGIYSLVWYYKVNREARDFDRRIDVRPGISLLAVLIGWIIIIPPFVSIYRTGGRIATMQRAAGMPGSCNGVIGVVLVFFVGLQSLYYQHELNQIWKHYGNPPEGAVVPLTNGADVTDA